MVGRLHDLGLASSEPHQPEIALGEEEEAQHRNAINIELLLVDSETVLLSESSSSFESCGHQGRQLGRSSSWLINRSIKQC